MNLLIETLPIHTHGNPCQGIDRVEDAQGHLPVPHEGVDEEQVPGEWHHGHLSAVWILEINGTVFNVVATPKEQLSLTVELKGLGWLVDLISSFQILGGSLGQFGLGSVDDLMEVVHLTERARWLTS